MSREAGRTTGGASGGPGDHADRAAETGAPSGWESTPPEALASRIARLPETAGVYLFRSAKGKTLYVGKAVSLRARVLSHFRAPPGDGRHEALLAQVAEVEVVATDSPREALLLENNLIKTRRPRYNILLRDDKNPPLVRLTMNETYPRVHIVRRAGADGAAYAGPYFPASLARRSMSLVHRLFGIRNCREQLNGRRPRPCLQYQIRRCIAPCVDTVCSLDEYRAAAESAKLFLSGRTGELTASLTRRMKAEAEAERFEEAARLRDSLRLLAELGDRQKMAGADDAARDVFGFYREGDRAELQVFLVRGGKVVDRDTFALKDLPPTDDAGLVEAALKQFYELGRRPPPRIESPLDFEERQLVAEWLSEVRGSRVEIVVPVKGRRRRMVDLVCRNARLAFDLDFREAGRKAAARVEALQQALHLPAPPQRIEAFDISNFSGRQVVASMVVMERGEPLPSAYRKFRIRTTTGKPDDYAAMREVVLRRYRRVLTEGQELPDLILLDGGRGQLSSAAAALHDLGLSHLPHAALAKREEEIWLPGAPEPLRLPRTSPALQLLERARDEAHRFAVTFHRQSRKAATLRSALDAVPGIGPRRRERLLRKFGSLRRVTEAAESELAAVVGASLAASLHARLHPDPPPASSPPPMPSTAAASSTAAAPSNAAAPSPVAAPSIPVAPSTAAPSAEAGDAGRSGGAPPSAGEPAP